MARVIINDRIDRAWFKERLRHRGMTRLDVARQLGIDRSSVHRAFTGQRFFSGVELGQLSILLQQPLTEVAAHAGIEFWQPPDDPEKSDRIQQQQEAYEAVQALARALGLTA